MLLRLLAAARPPAGAGLLCARSVAPLAFRGLSSSASVAVKMSGAIDDPVKKPKKPLQVTHVEAPLKSFRPTTPSMRHTILVDKSNLWRGRAIRQLTTRLKTHAGRNNTGRITVRARGGGHKRLYRFIDFKRKILDSPAVVQRFEYDPYRTAFIALIAYEDSTVSYILAPQGLKVGDVIRSSKEAELEIAPGNCMPLANMPIGTEFHNMEITPGKGGQIGRSAGTVCTLLDKRGKPGYGLVAICSKEQRYVLLNCMGTVGSVSNPMHHLQSLGKAGRNRWKGIRPHVRGVAMNPNDHPMGGGEGKSSGGRPPCSPTGVKSKGYKTNRKKNAANPLIVIPKGGVRKNNWN